MERLAGYKARWRSMVLRSMKNLWLTVNGHLPAGPRGRNVARTWARFSALVASNDDMAIGAMKALHERGVAVQSRCQL
ncbi:hypothetical protein ACVXHA_14620 [Escherichia coli]